MIPIPLFVLTWIGWKIYPHDILGMDPTDYRFEGAGFATQFKRIYPRK